MVQAAAATAAAAAAAVVVAVGRAAQDGDELLAEDTPAETIEDEVDGMVDVDEQVVDVLRHVVAGVARRARPGPVRPADRQHDAGRQACDEGERHAEAHRRRLQVAGAVRPVAVRPFDVHQRAHDGAVAAENRGERASDDDDERNPGPRVRLEHDVRLGAGAARRRPRPVRRQQDARPEDVRVLGERARDESAARADGARRPTHLRLAQREADGDEAVDGEGDEHPDGHVGRRVEEELAPRAAPTRERVGAHAEPGEPLDEQPREEDARVRHGHRRQVDVRRRLRDALPAQHEQREEVAAHSDDEQHRRHVEPHVAGDVTHR